ncbi:LysM peptidoglycan-binding domain-containing protein [Promicromonospora vindobonensis]|uniref:LysM peptidoglycan-binding domain-containing protein n=1 Tax=Promicromonospora vindobonensis TaxID=195748 RepID=A0ABW5VYR5_9MICO
MSQLPPIAPARATAGTRMRALGAAVVILAILAALPVLLVVTFPVVFPDWLLTRTGAEIVLFGGDLQRVALVLFYVGAWVFCLWFAWAVTTEIVVQARSLRRPHLVPVPAGVVGRLVAVLLTLLPVQTAFAQPSAAVAATLVDGADPVPDGVPDADGRGPMPDTESGSDDAGARPSDKAPVPADTAPPPASRLEPYIVRENDTLWGLALSRLGDGRRYPEIYDLNREVIGPKPGLLAAGATILLPTPTTEPARPVADVRGGEASYTVQPGDTLSEIAQAHLGDANRYPEIAAASDATVQPDGDRLTDPDHIEPGWVVTLPSAAKVVSDDVRSSPQEPNGSVTGGEHFTAPFDEEPSTRDDTAGTISETPPDATGTERETETETTSAAASWLVPGIASGAGILAAGLAGVVLRGRLRQARQRRPGRVIPPIPEELVPAAATARIFGARRVPDLHRLDLLLRQLGGPYLKQLTSQRPALIAVELTDDTAILHLAEPADLPAPWTGNGMRWSAPLDGAPDECREMVPYPMLVTIGTDDAGHAWLLDLERLRVTTVTGDSEAVARFARHIVAELALNPWTINLTTDVIGPVAPGARGLSGFQVEEHDDASALARFPDELREAYESDVNSEDIEWYHAVVAEAARAGELMDLANVISGDPGRNGLAILLVGKPDGEPLAGPVLTIENGWLVVPGLAVEVEAVHLRQEELDASVQLSRLMDDSRDVAVPVDPSARGWRALVNEAGAPRAEVVDARPEDPNEPAGSRSLLPGSDADYLKKTADTREDLARLAPVVRLPEATTSDETVGDDVGLDVADPALDQDLADWADAKCTRPRVKVLGPVKVWGAGPTTTVAGKVPTIYAVVGYVALHPEGVIASQIAAMAGVETTNVRSKLSDARAWLGNRPDGTPWLPMGQGGRPSEKRPPHRFRIEGCLVDADLFLRLRARAYRRGAAGLDDLVTALRLVRGRPFTVSGRPERWLWATEGEHRDAILTAAIVDVTELTIARSVVAGDLDLAREAYRIGTGVDPVGEVLKVSIAMLELADDHPERAQDLANEILEQRGDEWPEETSDRMDAIRRRTTQLSGN